MKEVHTYTSHKTRSKNKVNLCKSENQPLCWFLFRENGLEIKIIVCNGVLKYSSPLRKYEEKYIKQYINAM